MKNSACVFLLLSARLVCSVVEGILQTAALDIALRNGTTYTLLVSQASFGTYPKMTPSQNEPLSNLLLPPSDNMLLCNNVTTSPAVRRQLPSSHGGLMLVGRGNCTFEQKAYNAQQLGAAAVAIYGTLASRYSLNTTNRTASHVYTTNDIVYPQPLYDYDCSRGRAELPRAKIQMEPLPYNSMHNDPLLSGINSLCRASAPDQLSSCPSQACLLTNQPIDNKPSYVEACCAWDLAIWLYNDPKLDNVAVSIPAVYLTMQQAERLMSDRDRGAIENTVLYARHRPTYNLSAPLIWALGVFVATAAAFLSAGEYRDAKRQIVAHRITQSTETEASRRDEEFASQRHPDVVRSPSSMAEESLELNVGHALGFIVMASSGLLVLFFFKIYSVVKIMYAIGCSKAVSQVLFFPLVTFVGRRLNRRDKIVWRTNTEDFGDITLFDIVSMTLGFSLGLVWLVVAFTTRHPESLTFFWVTQDVMGSCMCVLFLSIIKLNSIHVASILLIVAFFYDIFFVFITPLIFKGESIMITVATSGGPPKADPSWCEKYPNDADCQGGDPLPMLLTVPRIGDYMGGSSMLGLGDIVLPGLLLSFAARLDSAKALLGVMGGGNGSVRAYTCPEDRCFGGFRICNGGYFGPVVVAYAVGLLMANAAVYLMNTGQPALLYLVPCCLGTMTYLGWRRNELRGLWNGPKALRTADAMIYGEETANAVDPGHTPLPTEEGIETLPAPSAEDGSGGQLMTNST